MLRRLQLIIGDERASVPVEYALLATCIALVIVSVVSSIGSKLGTMLNQATVALK